MADNKIRYEISTDVEYNIRTNDFSIEHTHDYWEIVFVVSGRIFNCINGEVTAIEKIWPHSLNRTTCIPFA